MTNLDVAMLAIQREIKAAALRGDIKHMRYLKSALQHLKTYLIKRKDTGE